MKLTFKQQKYRNASRMMRHLIDENQGWYEKGAIATSFGFVSAYRDPISYSLCFIWNGKEYEHSKRETISEQALIRRASSFANQIVGESLLSLEIK